MRVYERLKPGQWIVWGPSYPKMRFGYRKVVAPYAVYCRSHEGKVKRLYIGTVDLANLDTGVLYKPFFQLLFLPN